MAGLVWERLGDVKNYVEPFAGSLAVLLERPGGAGHTETVNDRDGLLCNFWRAMRYAPAEVARHADWPVMECDLHARHIWLVNHREDITTRLMGDPDWYDAKAAGWWVWGACAWIGRGWCSGQGPWQSVDGELAKVPGGDGVSRQVPHLFRPQGINRQLPHLSDCGTGINRVQDSTPDGMERGVSVHLLPVAERIKNVRVACGDWQRVVSKSVTTRLGLTGLFLDPPYHEGNFQYGDGGDQSGVFHQVRDWAIEHGEDPKLRIALCGYADDDDDDPLVAAGWERVAWKATGGYGSQARGKGRKNSRRERIWFSPHCLSVGGQSTSETTGSAHTGLLI